MSRLFCFIGAVVISLKADLQERAQSLVKVEMVGDGLVMVFVG
ncbi:hypothetical protein V6259_19090 [Marinomonas sp. TI.3.20]